MKRVLIFLGSWIFDMVLAIFVVGLIGWAILTCFITN